jgi:hypothetical protein
MIVKPAESSWLAAPFVDDLQSKFSDLLAVHLVRHPRDTIASLMTMQFFSRPSPYRDFARRHLPGLAQYDDPLAKAAYFYVAWNRMIQEHNLPVARLEDGPAVITWHLGIDIEDYRHKLPMQPVNVGPPPVEVDLETLPDELAARLEAISHEYAYDLSKSLRKTHVGPSRDPQIEADNEHPQVYWAVLMERSVQQDAVSALLDVAMTAGAAGAMRIGLPYTRTDQARNRIAAAFLTAAQNPNDTLVMLDCDHAHPPDIVPRLAAREEGVVGALAFRRSPPHEPMWFVRHRDGRLMAPGEYEPILYECDAVGTGAIAIKRWVFDKLVEQGTEYFFKYEYCEGGYSPSEDMYFAGLCEKAGIKHHVDCSLVTPHLATLHVNDQTWAMYRAGHSEILMEVEK